MRISKLSLAVLLALAVALVVPGVAMANFAIHGNYVADTDACAGCHRAHTSVSTITWTDTTAGQEQHSALLVTSATEMWQFCYACHDATSQGADTNVQQGIYEGTLYGTQGDVLNGGGFEEVGGVPVTSTHMYKGSSWGAYGGGYAGTGSTFAADFSDAGQGPNVGDPGLGVGNNIKMDCATCHDPHGSPNYRVLKTVVNGNPVGEYVPTAVPDDPDPNGFVSSVEPGWPVNGFRLHTAYPAYTPNYTTAMYAKGYDMMDATLANPATGINTTKGMSGWCTGCHSTYLGPVQTFTKANGTDYRSLASTYNAGDGSGLALRHKHPINVELDSYNGPDKANMIITGQVLPLAHDIDEQGAPVADAQDWIECLTCHRAHGTAAAMTGYAADTTQPLADGETGDASILDDGDPTTTVDDDLPRNEFPTADASALLRYDNRGVCERCHNK